MKRIGFTSGSFDPVTNGHLDVIARAARMVDTLVVGIGVHPGKPPLFSADERIAMLKAETAPIAGSRLPDRDRHLRQPHRRRGQGRRRQLILRGLRDGTDFDYEMQMAGMNGAMAARHRDGVPAGQPRRAPHHGTLVRQIALMGGDVSAFVSPAVAKRLKAKAARRRC